MNIPLYEVSRLINICPNPAEDQINIIGNEYELSVVRIFNALGQDVSNLTNLNRINQSTISIDLSQLVDGIYYIETRTSTSKVQKK